jgi:hypothetical protein
MPAGERLTLGGFSKRAIASFDEIRQLSLSEIISN